MKKYDLAEIIAREKGSGPLLEVDLGKGKTLTIPVRPLWPDAAIEAAKNDDIITAARELAGKGYDDFVKAGGTAVMLWEAITDALGVSLPEPKASTDS